jgi:hypothetical protein
MARVLGVIPGLLADLLDVEGGKIQSTDLRDREGISLVYDIGQLIESQSLILGVRNFDGSLGQGLTSDITLEGLPIMARLIAVNMSVSDDSRVNRAVIWGDTIGAAGAGGQCNLLWAWQSGGVVLSRPNDFIAGPNSQSTLLIPAINETSLPTPWVDVRATTRSGYNRILGTVTSTAFGAGTLTYSGNVVLLFPVALGGRSADLMPPPAK